MNERDIFLAALEHDKPEDRDVYLQEACGEDVELMAAVQALFRSHEKASEFLRTPAVHQVADRDHSDPESESPNQDTDPTMTEHANLASPTEGPTNTAATDVSLNFLEESNCPDSLGKLHHYEILEVIGRGAFGIVLRAFDEKLQRTVAIKVMLPELAVTSPARKRFLREARAAAALRHEHVVRIYAVEQEPLPYLVMEYVPGRTLQQRLDDEGPLDLPEVLRLGSQIAAGLAAAHENRIVHRDVKPGNILLETGVEERVKITDFGLARAADDASITQSGIVAGTPLYMAPEQALGKHLDQRADLFSLGSVLYQMASGRPPFRAPTALAVLKRVTEDAPRPITEIIPEIPTWFCDIVAQLHAKDPAQRLSPASQVAAMLGKCLADLEHATDPSLVAPVVPCGKRFVESGAAPKSLGSSHLITKRWWRAAAVLLVLTALAVIYVFKFAPSSLPATQWPPIPPEITLPPLAPLDGQRTELVQKLWTEHLEEAGETYGEDSAEYAATLRYWGLIHEKIDTLNQVRLIETKMLGRPTYQTLSILGYLSYLKNDFSSASSYLRQACEYYDLQENAPPIRPEENPYLWLAQVEYFQGLRDQRADTLRLAVNVHRRAFPNYTQEQWWREGKEIVLADPIDGREIDVAELCLAASRTPGQAAPDESYPATLGKLYRYKGWKDLEIKHYGGLDGWKPNLWNAVKIARAYCLSGDLDAALPFLNEALRGFEAQNNQFALPFEKWELGMLLRALGQEESSGKQFGEAAELLDAKLKTGGTTYSVGLDRSVFIQASAYRGSGVDPERLVQLGEEAVTLENNWWTIASLGLALEHADKVNVAIENYENGLDRWTPEFAMEFPSYMWIEERLFDLYTKTGQMERGITKLPDFVARRDNKCYRLHPEAALFRIHAARWLAGFDAGHELARQFLSEAKERLAYHPEVLAVPRVQADIEFIESQIEPQNK